MKKIVLLILVAFMAYSCTNDDEYVFDKNATERANDNLNEFKTHLGSTNWVIELFPEDYNKWGGYSIYSEFNVDKNRVDMINDEGVSDTDTNFDLIARSGSILSFNDYNKAIHNYANPSGASPEGEKGTTDYEFLYLKKEGNELYTKGVKTGNDIRFFATDLTADEYMTEITKVKTTLTSAGLLTPLKPGVNYIIYYEGRKLFAKDLSSGDVSEYPFVFRPNGIRFYDPIKLGDAEYYEFTLSDNKTLKTLDAEYEFKIVVPPIDFANTYWKINVADVTKNSNQISQAFNQIDIDNQNKWGEVLDEKIVFGAFKTSTGEVRGVGIHFNSSGYRAEYKLDFLGDPASEMYVNVLKNSPGFNWRWYTHFEPFVDLIADNSPYNVEIVSGTNDNPTEVKLTSVNNSNVWFTLTK